MDNFEKMPLSSINEKLAKSLPNSETGGEQSTNLPFDHLKQKQPEGGDFSSLMETGSQDDSFPLNTSADAPPILSDDPFIAQNITPDDILDNISHDGSFLDDPLLGASSLHSIDAEESFHYLDERNGMENFSNFSGRGIKSDEEEFDFSILEEDPFFLAMAEESAVDFSLLEKFDESPKTGFVDREKAALPDDSFSHPLQFNEKNVSPDFTEEFIIDKRGKVAGKEQIASSPYVERQSASPDISLPLQQKKNPLARESKVMENRGEQQPIPDFQNPLRGQTLPAREEIPSSSPLSTHRQQKNLTSSPSVIPQTEKSVYGETVHPDSDSREVPIAGRSQLDKTAELFPPPEKKMDSKVGLDEAQHSPKTIKEPQRRSDRVDHPLQSDSPAELASDSKKPLDQGENVSFYREERPQTNRNGDVTFVGRHEKGNTNGEQQLSPGMKSGSTPFASSNQVQKEDSLLPSSRSPSPEKSLPLQEKEVARPHFESITDQPLSSPSVTERQREEGSVFPPANKEMAIKQSPESITDRSETGKASSSNAFPVKGEEKTTSKIILKDNPASSPNSKTANREDLSALQKALPSDEKDETMAANTQKKTISGFEKQPLSPKPSKEPQPLPGKPQITSEESLKEKTVFFEEPVTRPEAEIRNDHVKEKGGKEKGTEPLFPKKTIDEPYRPVQGKKAEVVFRDGNAAQERVILTSEQNQKGEKSESRDIGNRQQEWHFTPLSSLSEKTVQPQSQQTGDAAIQPQIQQTATSPEAARFSHQDVEQLFNQLVEQITVLYQEGKTETRITLQNPPLLEGTIIQLESFDHAKREVNITFRQVTQEAQVILENNKAALISSLSEKQIVIQQMQISHELRRDDAPMTNNEPFSRFSQQQENSQQEEQRRQQQQKQEREEFYEE